jgi:hypothetical protein
LSQNTVIIIDHQALQRAYLTKRTTMKGFVTVASRIVAAQALRPSFSSSAVRPLSAKPSFREAVSEANADQDSKVVIQETPDGRGYGLFARATIVLGDLVFRGTALETTRQRTSHSIQLDWEKHVTMDAPAILVNHSCAANLGIRENDLGAYDFYALRDIPSSSELLWDYETAESEMSGFDCECGDPECRGQLKGFQSHGDQVLATYSKGFVAPYLLREKV